MKMTDDQYDLYLEDIKIGTVKDINCEYLDCYGTLEPDPSFSDILEYDGFIDEILDELVSDESFTASWEKQLIEQLIERLDMGVQPTLVSKKDHTTSPVLFEISGNNAKWRYIEDSAIMRINGVLNDLWSYVSELAETGHLDRHIASQVLDDLNKMMSSIEDLEGKEKVTSKVKNIVDQQLKLSVQGLRKNIEKWEREEAIPSEISDELLDGFDKVLKRISSLGN